MCGFPDTREIASPSQADWLNRRSSSRVQCSGVGASRSASASALRARTRHPPGERLQAVAPPAPFEIQHQLARVIVIGERGARGRECRRIGGACAAERAVLHGRLEGKAACRAQRPGQELQLRPPRRLDCARTIDNAVRQQGARRPHDVGRPRED